VRISGILILLFLDDYVTRTYFSGVNTYFEELMGRLVRPVPATEAKAEKLFTSNESSGRKIDVEREFQSLFTVFINNLILLLYTVHEEEEIGQKLELRQRK
jgi:hypothetical protein